MNYSAPSTSAPKPPEGQQELHNLVKMVIYLLVVSCYISLLWNLEYLRENYCSTICPRPCRFRYRGRGGSGARRRRPRRTRIKRKSSKKSKKMVIPKHKMREKGKTCTICQVEIELNSTCKQMPTCKHDFHADCIDEWLKVSSKCPNCRIETV